MRFFYLLAISLLGLTAIGGALSVQTNRVAQAQATHKFALIAQKSVPVLKPTAKPAAKPKPALQAVMGTYSVADHKGNVRIGNSMLVKIIPEQKNSLQIGVFNGRGYKQSYKYLVGYPSNVVNWFADPHYLYGNEKYTVQTKIDGSAANVKTSIDPYDVLATPDNLEVASSGWNRLSVQWDAVAQAPIYFVQVYRSADEPVAIWSTYTRSPSASFKRSLLRYGNNYFVSVAAFNVDVTNRKLELPKQFNVSYADTQLFKLTGRGIASSEN